MTVVQTLPAGAREIPVSAITSLWVYCDKKTDDAVIFMQNYRYELSQATFLISYCQYLSIGMADGMDKEQIVRKIRDVIASQPLVRVAYVYGSFVSRDTFHDIDIALLLDAETGEDPLKFVGRAGDLLDVELGFRYECDVRCLNDEPVWFQFEVISTGMPVYIRNADDRIDFETQVLIEYHDMKYTYDLFDQEYLARV